MTNVNPIAPHNDIEFAATGNGIIIFAIGFHGNPVNIHSRAHNTAAHIPAKTNGRADAAQHAQLTNTNGIEKIIPPATAIPSNPGIVHIANCCASSGKTYIECNIHQNIATA